MARPSAAVRPKGTQLRWAQGTADALRALGCDAIVGVELLARRWGVTRRQPADVDDQAGDDFTADRAAGLAAGHAGDQADELSSDSGGSRQTGGSDGIDRVLDRAAEVADASWTGARPDLLVLLYESMLSAVGRRSGGVHYTPRALAEFHTDFAIDRMVSERGLDWLEPGAIVDPSCGSGAYLLAAARALLRHGADPARIRASLTGWDIDQHGLAVARLAVDLLLGPAANPGDRSLLVESGSHAAVAIGEETPIVLHHGDFLARDDSYPAPWIIVGNPPFLGQLKRSTSTDADAVKARAERLGLKAQPYADVAALFLADCTRWVRTGGVVSLLQPHSVLSARDALGPRRSVGANATPLRFWVDDTPQFGAAVHVWCAPFVRTGEAIAGRARLPVVVGIGADAAERGVLDWAELCDSSTWGAVIATARQIPPLDTSRAPTLGPRVWATAGFRDEFYAIAAHTVERSSDRDGYDRDGSAEATPPRHSERWRTLTSGSIDPGIDRWGARPTRLGGRVFVRPVLDRAALGASMDAPAVGSAAASASAGKVARWVDRLAVPKVLVATQTRVIEACADLDGGAVPVTPVIAAVPVGISVGQLLCALLSPAATVWAHRRSGGAGLSAGALRLRADDLVDLPVPADDAAWASVGEWCTRQVTEVADRGYGLGPAAMIELARRMQLIQGFGDEVFDWWAERAPGL